MKIGQLKIRKYELLVLGLFLAAYGYFNLGSQRAAPQEMEWGITFSKAYAESLGIPWRETYLAILDDLKARYLRLPVYWNEIEANPGEYNFADMDYLVAEAEKRGAKIILVVGRRLPHWPECHEPEWLASEEWKMKSEKLLKYVEAVVRRYQTTAAVEYWQVENEFFLRRFGHCPVAYPELLDEEIALVRSLDKRPIILTDSGELGGWWGSIRRADIFGTTMYRTVYNNKLGYATYPLKPVYYQRRFWLYKPFGSAKEIINVELQAEPWSITNTVSRDSTEEWNKSLSPAKFAENLKYAEASGIKRAYLWGAEWWYYAKEVRKEGEIWQVAKTLWAP